MSRTDTKADTMAKLRAELDELREMRDAILSIVDAMQRDVLDVQRVHAHAGYLAHMLQRPAKLRAMGRYWVVDHGGVSVPFIDHDMAVHDLEQYLEVSR